MNVNELLELWLDERSGELKYHTLERYRGTIRDHISPVIGDMDIGEIKRSDIQRVVSAMREIGLSPSSINISLSVIKLAFRYACESDIIENDSAISVRRVADAPSEARALSKVEQVRIERYIADNWAPKYIGIMLCLYTGLRIGELLALKWSDIDLERGIISVNKTVYIKKEYDGSGRLVEDKPKTRSSERMIPVPYYVRDMLASQYMKRRGEHVVENKKGEQMSARSYQYIFKSTCKRSGINEFNFHSLRHTFATRAIECGMDIKTLSEIMGHKNATVTLNRYAHSMMDTKITMMNKLVRCYKK